jgi:CheY-like chemotaxis protein
MTPEPEVPMSDTPTARNRYVPGMKILVVEDSASARKLLQGLLLRLGIRLEDLRMAPTIPEALQLFAQWRPDIVFLDLELRPTAALDAAPITGGSAQHPKNGAELAAQLVQRNPSLKIIVCSASQPEETEIGDLLRKRKMQSIVKPILAAKVQEALEALGALPGPSATRR